jgi:hypothetical protein
MAEAAPKLEDTQEYKDLEASKATVADLGKEREASIKSEGDILARQRQEIEPAVKETQGLMAEQQKRLAEPPPEAPKLGTPPKVSDYFNKDVGTMLLTAATLVAGIGAGAGRVRGIRAMNSLAGGINGYVAGNLQAAHDGIQDYANQMEAQIKEYQLLTERSNNIITRGGMSIQNKLNELQLLKAVHGMMLDEETVKQKGIGAHIEDTMHQMEITSKLISALNQARRMEQEAKHQAEQEKIDWARIVEGREYHQGMIEAQKEKRESALLDKPGQAGFYYDKELGGIMPDRPTVREMREAPGRFVRMGQQQQEAFLYMKNARNQIPYLRRLASEALAGGPLVSGVTGLTARVTSPKMAEFKAAKSTMKTEATAIESRGNRIITGVMKNIEDQFPDAGTRPDVAQAQLSRLMTSFEQRIHSIVGREPLGKDMADQIWGEVKENNPTIIDDNQIQKLAEELAKQRGYDF